MSPIQYISTSYLNMNLLIIEDDILLASQIARIFAGRMITNRVRMISSSIEFTREVHLIRSYDIIITDLQFPWDRWEPWWYTAIEMIRDRCIEASIWSRSNWLYHQTYQTQGARTTYHELSQAIPVTRSHIQYTNIWDPWAHIFFRYEWVLYLWSPTRPHSYEQVSLVSFCHQYRSHTLWVVSQGQDLVRSYRYRRTQYTDHYTQAQECSRTIWYCSLDTQHERWGLYMWSAIILSWYIISSRGVW
jgi:hypothetical protein